MLASRSSLNSLKSEIYTMQQHRVWIASLFVTGTTPLTANVPENDANESVVWRTLIGRGLAYELALSEALKDLRSIDLQLPPLVLRCRRFCARNFLGP